MKLLTTSEVAQAIGITSRGLLKRAEAIGIKPAEKMGSMKLWRPRDVKQFRKGLARGRPRVKKG